MQSYWIRITLVLDDGTFEPGADFRCAALDESLTAMTRIGEVEFAPGELIRPLHALRDGQLSGLEDVASATTAGPPVDDVHHTDTPSAEV